MAFLFGKKFDIDKTKVQLKLAVGRVRLVKNKKANAQKMARKEIATMLLHRKEESARIRVEHVIREDCMLEALELIELFAELLLARIHCLTEPELRDEIKEAVCSLIYVANKVDVDELREVRQQLVTKYGKEFADACERNVNNCVSGRLYSRVNYRTPEMFRVLQYLGDIAAEEKVQWQPPAELIQAIEAPAGSQLTGQITVSYPTGPFAAPAIVSGQPALVPQPPPPAMVPPPAAPHHTYVGGEPPMPGSQGAPPPSYGAPPPIAPAPSGPPAQAPSFSAQPPPKSASPPPPPSSAPPSMHGAPPAAPPAEADPLARQPDENEDDYLMRRLEALKNRH